MHVVIKSYHSNQESLNMVALLGRQRKIFQFLNVAEHLAASASL